MGDSKDTRTRKWLLTINNPADFGWTHDRIKLTVENIKAVEYWCMCDEIGEQGTYHTHIFLAFTNAKAFSKLKKDFPQAHFDMCKGTAQDNRDYIAKEGKWENDKKHETNLPDTFEEFGEMPMERQGQRNDIRDLYDMIKQGMTNYEILEMNPEFMLKIEKIDKARQIVNEERFKNEFRMLEVTYIYGNTGTGKTRGVMEQFGYSNVYRITDYQHPFDAYAGQDIILFEEFRSSLKMQDLLVYLDGYPVELPARYGNKVACFTKVFFTTNIPLDCQYDTIQKEYKETWKAFLRRISKVKIYKKDEVVEYTIDKYINRKEDFMVVSDEEIEQLGLPFPD
ncbi:MAG: replication protein [Lachnospiraceae bacterium]|nr:replication protein [Lachnospiraceae bacterium]